MSSTLTIPIHYWFQNRFLDAIISLSSTEHLRYWFQHDVPVPFADIRNLLTPPDEQFIIPLRYWFEGQTCPFVIMINEFDESYDENNF